MTALFRAAAAAAALALAGCLTSDGLLFDQKNARALALDEGRYDACQYDNPTAAPDCKGVDVTRDATGLYTFQIDEEGEPPTFVRFKRIGSGAFAAQLWNPGDDDPFYFLVTRAGAELSFSMIDCKSLPDSYKSRYVARGQLEIRDSSTCVAKTAGAVVAGAKAWRGTDQPKTGPRIVYRTAA